MLENQIKFYMRFASQTSMNALMLILMTVTSTPCVRTLKDLMFVVVKKDILEMVETAQVKCHDVFHRSILDVDAFNIFFYHLHDSNSVFILFTHLDLDECASPNECDLNALCTNTEGSYVCRCRKGFAGDGRNCTGNNSC